MSKNEKYAEYYCPECDVQLHDDDNFKNHLRGKPHLKMLQRIREDKARRGLLNYETTNTRTGMSYYELPSQFEDRVKEYYKQG